MLSRIKRFFNRGQPSTTRPGAGAIREPVEIPNPGSGRAELPINEVQPKGDAHVFRTRGERLLGERKYGAAIAMFDSALDGQPSDVDTLIFRSLAYTCSRTPNLDQAMQDVNSAIEYNPRSWEAWEQKGVILGRTGHLQEAVEALENADGLVPDTHQRQVWRSLATARDALSSSITADLPIAPATSSSPLAPTLSNQSHSGAQNPSLTGSRSPTVSELTSQELPTRPAQQEGTVNSYANQSSSQSASEAAISPPSVHLPNTPSALENAASGRLASPPISSQTTQSTSISPLSSSTFIPTAATSPQAVRPPSGINIHPPNSPSNVANRRPVSQTSSGISRQPPNNIMTPANSPTSPGTRRAPRSTSHIPALSPSPNPSPSSATSRPPAPSQTPNNVSPAIQRSEAAQSRVPPQPTHAPPVSRAYNTSNVPQSNSSTLPLSSGDLIDFSESSAEAPPEYTESSIPRPATEPPMTTQQVETRITQLQTSMAAREKGGLSITCYTSAGNIDACLLLYVGMTIPELTSRELAPMTFLHPSFSTMVIDAVSIPKNTFADMDCESISSYEGKIPGTTTIAGYSEEYRQDQLLRYPLLNLALEGLEFFAPVAVERVVAHLRALQLRPDIEDDNSLKAVLGLSQIQCLKWGFTATGTRQRRIDSLCMALTRGLYDAPARFIDFSRARTFSNNFVGSGAQGIGVTNMLFQILIGAELLIRLRKEPATSSYASIVTDNISALMAVSAMWMKSISITGPSLTSARYMFSAANHRRQSEGLIRFAEAIGWPYMDEARHYIENVYQSLSSGQTTGFDMYDWLYGLILPGKIFRHRIMACLVYASASTRSLSGAPYYENGLVVQSKSYWPKRTVLGRVLGGLRNPKSICGWIGPVPAPMGTLSGWIRLSARLIEIPPPVVRSTNLLESLGFNQADGGDTREGIIQSITNADEYNIPTPPTRTFNDSSRSVFKGIELELIPGTATPTSTSTFTTTSILPTEQYRASLTFEVNSISVRYTLYSNPVFVAAPPCVGVHTLHRRQATMYLGNVIRVNRLTTFHPEAGELVVIDALGEGEEVVARAWCAERGRHAVVRRGDGCCFACAAKITVGETGLGVNVLIWSR